MDKLLKILGTIYDTKKRMKAVLGTQSDDICEYPTLIHNYFVDLYNERYATGFNDGYTRVWMDYIGQSPRVPMSPDKEKTREEYTPNIPTVTEYRDQRLADNLAVIMEEVYQARLDMKEELGTNSDLFVTYPDILSQLMIDAADDYYQEGYDDGYAAGLQIILNEVSLSCYENTVTITTDSPYGTIQYSIDGGPATTYINPIDIISDCTVTAWLVFDGGYTGPVSTLNVIYVPEPVIQVFDNHVVITNIIGKVFYDFNSSNIDQNDTLYTQKLIYNSSDTSISAKQYTNDLSNCSKTVTVSPLVFTPWEELTLGFDIIRGGKICLEGFDRDPNKHYYNDLPIIDYSINGGEWQTAVSIADRLVASPIIVDIGDNIRFRYNTGYIGVGTFFSDYLGYYPDHIDPYDSELAIYDVYGNIMSLVYTPEQDFSNKTTFINVQPNVSDNPKYITFKKIFAGFNRYDATTGYKLDNVFVNDISNLVLPATTLVDECYMAMFRGCINITSTPTLPATTLANSCYYQMFYGCTSLTTAPELPALRFQNQYTSFTNCYRSMFQWCTGINYIKAMFIEDIGVDTWGYPYNTHDWVDHVASSGTFVKNQNAIWNYYGVSGIPTGWTVIEE